jgi:hypothetical protein
MTDIHLTQAEADALMAMEKIRADDTSCDYPITGTSICLPLLSRDKRENFLLDVSRSRIDLQKVKHQNRARQVIVLVRLDLGRVPHRNPDGEDIIGPHLHIYREEYGDKWAIPVPTSRFSNLTDLWRTLQDFMRYCNITEPPHINRGLFV